MISCAQLTEEPYRSGSFTRGFRSILRGQAEQEKRCLEPTCPDERADTELGRAETGGWDEYTTRAEDDPVDVRAEETGPHPDTGPWQRSATHPRRPGESNPRAREARVFTCP